jgi:uncharacterized protein
MARILFWLLVILVVQWFWRLSRRDDATRRARRGGPSAGRDDGAQTARQRAAQAGPNGRSPAALPEAMVRCAQCGVHAPLSETVTVDGRQFCCRDHATQYAARPVGRDAR